MRRLVGIVLAGAVLAPGVQKELERDLLRVVAEFNRAEDGSMVAPSEYLEIVITR